MTSYLSLHTRTGLRFGAVPAAALIGGCAHLSPDAGMHAASDITVASIGHPAAKVDSEHRGKAAKKLGGGRKALWL